MALQSLAVKEARDGVRIAHIVCLQKLPISISGRRMSLTVGKLIEMSLSSTSLLFAFL